MSEFITPAELAERWRLSEQTLANWRLAKKGPAFTKLGDARCGRVLYALPDVIAWETRRRLACESGGGQ